VKILLLPILAVAVMGFSSCHEDLPTVIDSSNNLLGLWSLSSSGATQYSNGLFVEGIPSNSVSGTIEFRPSGWGTMNFAAAYGEELLQRSQEFSWQSNDSQLLINQSYSSAEAWDRSTNLSTLQAFSFIEAVNDTTNVVYLLNFSFQE